METAADDSRRWGASRSPAMPESIDSLTASFSGLAAADADPLLRHTGLSADGLIACCTPAADDADEDDDDADDGGEDAGTCPAAAAIHRLATVTGRSSFNDPMS